MIAERTIIGYEIIRYVSDDGLKIFDVYEHYADDCDCVASYPSKEEAEEFVRRHSENIAI